MQPFKHSDKTKAILIATLHRAPENPDPLVSSRSLSRGTTIVGLMLEQLGDKRGQSKRPGSILVRAGSFAWGLVELAAPRSLGQILFQYWIVLAYALAAMMLVVGIVSNSQAVIRAGYLVLSVSLIVHILVEKLRRWMATGDISKLKPVRFIVPLVLGLLGCVVVGGRMHEIEVALDRNGAASVDAGHRAGAVLRANTLADVLGKDQTEKNRNLMIKSLEWDTLFIVCYTVAFLSLGWLIATHFDRPFRAFALVAAATFAIVVLDLAENIQAYLILEGHRQFSPLYTTDLKLLAALLTTVLLALQGIVAWLETRSVSA